MLSTKGFLAPGPDRRPRMTAKHKAAVELATKALLDFWTDTVEIGGMAAPSALAARAIIAAALATYPTDRSCITCDYLNGVTCQRWKEVIPAEAIEAGCDSHQEDSAPF